MTGRQGVRCQESHDEVERHLLLGGTRFGDIASEGVDFVGVWCAPKQLLVRTKSTNGAHQNWRRCAPEREINAEENPFLFVFQPVSVGFASLFAGYHHCQMAITRQCRRLQTSITNQLFKIDKTRSPRLVTCRRTGGGTPLHGDVSEPSASRSLLRAFLTGWPGLTGSLLS